MRKTLATALGVALVGAGGLGALAKKDDGDHGIRGPAAEHARAAAVTYLGGGRAGGVERDDEHGAAFSVEVQRDDGTIVDVFLDASLRPFASEVDSED